VPVLGVADVSFWPVVLVVLGATCAVRADAGLALGCEVWQAAAPTSAAAASKLWIRLMVSLLASMGVQGRCLT
jgi:hypothetical protein